MVAHLSAPPPPPQPMPNSVGGLPPVTTKIFKDPKKNINREK
jgi:hypothetical protein